MSDAIFDPVPVEIPCPKCGHQTTRSVGWIKTHKELICMECAGMIRLERQHVLDAIQDAERAIKSFRSDLKRLSEGLKS